MTTLDDFTEWAQVHDALPPGGARIPQRARTVTVTDRVVYRHLERAGVTVADARVAQRRLGGSQLASLVNQAVLADLDLRWLPVWTMRRDATRNSPRSTVAQVSLLLMAVGDPEYAAYAYALEWTPEQAAERHNTIPLDQLRIELALKGAPQ